jgi:hypothetical protein
MMIGMMNQPSEFEGLDIFDSSQGPSFIVEKPQHMKIFIIQYIH